MLRALPPVLLLALSTAACTVGDLTPIDDDGDGSGGGGGDDTPDPTVSLQVAPGLADTRLDTTTQFTVTVNATDYAGDVALVLENAPPSWETSFSPDVLTFAGDGQLTSTLTVTIPPNGDTGTIATQVVGSATMGEQVGALSFSVDNVYEVPIANNTGAGGAHEWPDVTINAGTTVRFVNYDTQVAHTIHADGVIAHEDDQMAKAPAAGQAGGSYEYTVTQTGDSVFYCHDHGANTGTGLLVSE